MTPPRLAVLAAALAIGLMEVGNALAPAPLLAGDVPAPLAALSHWDAGWYAEIASHGYWYHPGQQSPVAYFPLFPLVLMGLVKLGVNRWLAGVAASLTFGLLGLWLFSRWARALRPSNALTASQLLVIYPFAIYLYGIIYSDGLFLTCVTAAFLFLERDRPVLATVFGALATACRPVALAVVVGLVVRSLERRRTARLPIRAVDLVPAASLVGIAAWMVFLDASFHDALAWVHVQAAPGWDQPPGWQTWLKLSWFHTMFPRVPPMIAIRLGGHALVTLCSLALLVPTFRRLGFGYGLYCLIVIGIPSLGSKDFQGLGRYAIAAFPLFLTLATLLDERPRLKRPLLAVFGAFFIFCAIAFGEGGYVA